MKLGGKSKVGLVILSYLIVQVIGVRLVAAGNGETREVESLARSLAHTQRTLL